MNLGNRLGRNRRVHHRGIGGVDDTRDRRDVADEVEIEVGVKCGVDGIRRQHNEQCSRPATLLRRLRCQHYRRRPAGFRRRIVGRAALTAIGLSGARRCRMHCQQESQQLNAPTALERFARSRSATGSAARQHLLPDAEIGDGKVSRVMLHELEHPCPPTIISKSSLNVCFWH